MAALKLWGTSTFKNFTKEVNHQLYTPVNHGQKEETKKKQNDSDHNKRYEHHTQLKSGPAETSHQGGALECQKSSTVQHLGICQMLHK
jgi:hypothetical protein